MSRLLINSLSRLFSRYGSEETSNEAHDDSVELGILSTQNHEEDQQEQRHGYTTKTVSDCKDVSEALQLFDFAVIKDELMKVEETLLLKIQLDLLYGPLRPNELHLMSKKCKNKAIVVVFTTKNEDISVIYWKSKVFQDFLTLSSNSDTPAVTELIFNEFLGNFLADSLANKHFGLLNSAFNSVFNSDERDRNIELNTIADIRNYNLLLLAAESGRNDIVKIMLSQKLETEVKCDGKLVKAQDLAYQAKHYDVVYTLIKAGNAYPDSFNIEECSLDLKEFCAKSEEFHSAVISKNVTKIKEMLSQTENSHPFYNKSNQSAAKAALNDKLIDIYELLITCKVFLGRHEVLHDSWDNFSEFEREKLRKIHFKNAIHLPEKHLSDLINCTSVSYDDQNVRGSINLAQYAFRVLNQIESIRIILMIVAASRKLEILFDFKSESVDVVDPTASSTTKGLFYIKGIICIAANHLKYQSEEHETFGTLAHELCHYAMYLVYRNMSKPYGKKDKERREEYEKIVKICKENRNKDYFIYLVFEYPSNMHHAELIVRVPHLMALYHNQPEILKEIRGYFSELFNYYEQKVVPDMEKALPKIEKEIERMDREIIKNKIMTFLVMFLSVIIIISGFFIMRAFLYKPHYNFNDLSGTDQNKIRNALVNYKNVQLQFKDLFPHNSQVYNNLTSENILQMLNDQPLNFSDPHSSYLNDFINHDWENMTQKLKKEFLNKKFTFQNESLKFGKLNIKIQKAFKVLSTQQIIDVLDEINPIVIHKIIPNSTVFYIERKFWSIDTLAIYWAHGLSLQRTLNNSKVIVEALKSELKFRDYFERFNSKDNRTYKEEINRVRQNVLFQSDAERSFTTFYFNPIHSFETFKENFEEIFKKSENLRMFILSGEAGTGKTTVFEQLTLRIKRIYQTRWVSYIDLKDYTQLYTKNKLPENPLDLLEEILELKSERMFEKAIFEELFDLGEVVLLWNGFDEISPMHSDFVLKILSTIHKSTKNIQFVCTRPLYAKQLEDYLGVNHHILVPFDKKNHEKFLKDFFISVKVVDDKIPNYIDKVNNIVKTLRKKPHSWNDYEDFSTPLILKMIADLIANEDEIRESENVYKIYEKFIQRKVRIWKDKNVFFSVFAESLLTEYHKFDMIEMYQKYALRKIRWEIFTGKLKIFRKKVPKELTSDEISRMGILYINGKDNFKFAHQTFSEFFLAQFFIENIYNAEDADPEDAILIIQCFRDVLKQYDIYQVMITNFIKSFIETQNSKENKKFDTIISEIFRTKFKNFFFDFLLTEKSEIFEFLFDFFSKDHKLLIDLLHVNENETLYTAAYNNAYFKESAVNLNRTRLNELGKIYLTEEEYAKFINGKNQKGIILFSQFQFYRESLNKKKQMIDKKIIYNDYDLDVEKLINQSASFILNSIAKNLTENEVKELYLSTSCPLYYNEDYIYLHENFWDITSHLLTEQEKKLFFINLFTTVFERSRISPKSVSYLLEKAKEILNLSEILKIFKDTNILHWTATYSSADSDRFNVLWNFFVNYTCEDEQKEILLEEVSDKCFWFSDINPNHKCYGHLPLNIVQILMISQSSSNSIELPNEKEYFNETEQQEIILKSNNFLPYFIMENNLDECRDFSIKLKTLFSENKESLKDFLLRKINPTNMNIFELMEVFIEYSEKLKIFSDLLKHLSK